MISVTPTGNIIPPLSLHTYLIDPSHFPSMYSSCRPDYETVEPLSLQENERPHSGNASRSGNVLSNPENIPQVNDNSTVLVSNQGTEPQKLQRLRSFVNFARRVTSYHRRQGGVSDRNIAAVSDQPSQTEPCLTDSLSTAILPMVSRDRPARAGYGDASEFDNKLDSRSRGGQVSP